MSLVAIVGRPNVGKSTLFNRLTEERRSIVHDEPGVTRDRIYGHMDWGGRTMALVDTGGFVPGSADRFEAAIREQVHLAIEEAGLILLVVDVTTGITDLDAEMASTLRRSGRPVILVVNKADNDERRWGAGEFYALGFEEVFALSSINGMGTGDLLDRVVELLPPDPEPVPDERPRIAFIGRPNVGKSSLTNALLGTERSIVTEISGTTRDSIDTELEFGGQKLVLVDTAGLRRKARIQENVEFYAWLRTERAIETCDVAVLLIDAVEGLEAQDIRVLASAERMKKGLIIGINKWDLYPDKETNSVRDYERLVRDRLKTLSYVPIITLSAITHQRIHKVLDAALGVIARRRTRVSTSQLNDVLGPAIERHHPPSYRGHYVKIKYVTQVRADPPVFNFFCNYPKGIGDAYRRYLENQIRSAFDFDGVPLTLVFKAKS